MLGMLTLGLRVGGASSLSSDMLVYGPYIGKTLVTGLLIGNSGEWDRAEARMNVSDMGN